MSPDQETSKDPKIYRAVFELLETVYYIAIAEENVVAMRGIGMPKTVDDAIKRLIANMPLKFKVDLSKMDEGELVNLHFTFGVFIRNQFGLWNENADLLNDCRKLSGIDFMNADDAAAFIIRGVVETIEENTSVEGGEMMYRLIISL